MYIPSKDEYQELFNNTSNQWIENYNNSGVNGRLFVSNINNNSIFIPATGYLIDNHIYDYNKQGFLWSKTLSTIYHSYDLCFSSYHIEIAELDTRDIGEQLRPVKIKKRD